MRRPPVQLLATLGAAAVVRSAAGCAAEDSGAPSDDAGLDAVVVDARVERVLPPEGDVTYPSPFDGWDLYPDYDPQCQLYVPKARENLPPPISWEPCRSNPETSSKSCRQMVLDWQPQAGLQELISPATQATRRADGHVALMTARYQLEGTFRIVAEADGPTLVAVREQDATRCVLNNARSDGEYYAYRVLDREAKGEVSSYGGGAIGGRLDELRPKALRHYHDSFTRGFIAGAPGLLEVSGGAMQLFAWSDGSLIKKVWSSDQDNGLAQNFQFFHGDTLFWASDSYAINKQKVHTDAAGVKDLLSFGNDTSRGIADLGTDGEVLVWIEGSDRPQPSGVFPTVTAFVSPFTTDPAQIQKRALRADLSGYPFGTSPFVVGCGYAARTVEMKRDGGFQGGTLLVRLADGYAWHLPDGPGVDWGWRTPLALTCDELFVRVVERPTPDATPRTTVARVRLDSLGSPMPP